MSQRKIFGYVLAALACSAACSEDAPSSSNDAGFEGAPSPANASDASAPLDAASSSTNDEASVPSTARDAATADASTVPVQPMDAMATVPSSDAGVSDATTGNAEAAVGDGSAPAVGTSCLKGSGDYTKPGPYKFKQKNVTIGSKGAYTIVYPDPLEAACPHPFVAWGNGTFITGGTAYAPFNEHAASWGIVSIASHNSSVGDGTFHRAAIDYMLAQNKESGSEFFGKLSERAGVSGHSQGGAGADRSASHPNVKAIANVQGSFGTPPMSTAAFLCLTGTEDIQPTGCPMAVKAAKVPALSASYQGADHVSTTLGGGTGIEQYTRLYSAWFRCFLADDATACAMFKGGAECPVCKERGWAEIFANNY